MHDYYLNDSYGSKSYSSQKQHFEGGAQKGFYRNGIKYEHNCFQKLDLSKSNFINSNINIQVSNVSN